MSLLYQCSNHVSLKSARMTAQGSRISEIVVKKPTYGGENIYYLNVLVYVVPFSV